MPTLTLPEGKASAPAALRLTPVQRLWLVCAACLVAAGVLWIAAVRGLPVHGSPRLSWWWLVLPFAATELWPLIVGMRRRTASLGMSACPLVVALAYSAPPDLLIAYTLGASIAAATRRPFNANRTALLLAQVLVFSAVAELVFNAIAAPGARDWQVFLGLAVAVAAVTAGNLGLIVGGAALEQRVSRVEALAQLVHGAAGAVAALCLGVIAVEVIGVDVPVLAFVAVLGLGILLCYRAYTVERQERDALEFLHRAGDALGSRELESALVQLLRRAQSMFNAELAQLTIFPSSLGEKAFRTTVRAHEADQVMEPVELGQLDDLLEAESNGVIIERAKSPQPAADMLARRGIDEAMVALLRGETRMLGSLVVGGHVDARSFDRHDLQLFQTLAVQTTTTLENGRMERSIARLTELQEQLAHQAFHDALTGLANRTLFGDRIEHALERSSRGGRSVAVLFIDVDDFKGVNDTFGHAAGDGLLVGLADRLRSTLRRPDTAARLGGDEFAVLLEDLDESNEADVVARRIFEALRSPFDVNGQTVNVRVSIGVAIAQRAGDSASNLMRHADVAMYSAKGSGKDRWVVFAPGMETDIVTRHRLRTELEVALGNDQFAVHYQPIVDLRSGDITGLEALVRWRHPARGLVGPDDFIAMAEESGLILQLGDHVLRSACAALLRFQARNPRRTPLSVAVNISARQLQQPLFVENVLAIVAESGVLPHALTLELTESILLGDTSSSIVKLEALQRAGVRIAIDDFGTGYSSLSYLRQLPVDILKIAKPFVDDLAAAHPNSDFVSAIVGLASAL
ncbi:MAG: putative bifunctional diguanylate cyclase/phosphodiesterase, partial [Candidatus Dormibacteria bacterium]